MSGFKYSAITGTLGQLSDRFMGCGYKEGDQPDFERTVKRLKALDVLDALELCYQKQGIESDAKAVRAVADECGFEISFVNGAFHSERRFKFGSFLNPDAQIRKQAIEECFKLIDFAEDCGAAGVNLWLGQDGFDYPFQTDYTAQWRTFISEMKTVADYKPAVKLALEPKLREPRNRSFIDTTATALLICAAADRDNLGVTVDIGHVLQAGGNMARDIELAWESGRLFNVHANDNYASWDDDMIVGSVHLIENIELFYALRKLGFDRYLSVDIFPFREDAFAATKESVLNMKAFDKIVDRIGEDRLEALIKSGDPCKATRLFREILY